MNEREETQFETQLREHFAGKLDSHLGKSGRRFMQEFGAAATPRLRLVDESAPAPHRPLRLFGWSAGIATLAVAAGIAAVMVFAPLLTQQTQPVKSNGTGLATRMPSIASPTTQHDEVADPLIEDEAPFNVEHALTWNTVDQGTVYLPDGLPVRSVVRQANESMKWYDPERQAHIEMTVPRDEVMLVGYQSQ